MKFYDSLLESVEPESVGAGAYLFRVEDLSAKTAKSGSKGQISSLDEHV